ncbi:MAG: excinuclease ABC subunit UvrC [Acidobacteria bacterium]|nr:MAG: excinuclease ABC subunit UvrC [Acidobacteriota bacterium]
MRRELEDRIRALPDRAGVYLFLDAGGEALYVGKAKSLQKRVVAYTKVDSDPRLGAMVREAHQLDFVVTDSEADALLLENNLIKNRQPRYNIRLRDDKTYPYLKLTLGDDYPRVAFTRRMVDDGSEYYGPFLPGGLARRAIKLVQRLFEVRVCRIEIDGKLPRPCLYYDMKRCLGPCVAGLTSRDEYAVAVDRARLFLAGKTDDLVASLRSEMLDASERLEYEQAAQLRDVIAEIEAVQQRRQLGSGRSEDVDIYGACIADGKAAVTVLVMRDGQVLDRRELFFEEAGAIGASELLDDLLPQIYQHTTFVPKEIHLPVAIEGSEALELWLGERRGNKVTVHVPERGVKAHRVATADDNARMAFKRRFRLGRDVDPGALVLKDLLGLGEVPARIEGFDISTFQGRQTVASMVVWEEGRMARRAYRSFNIRDLSGPDDFAAMQQVLERRYARVLEETGEMPDLVLVDGGHGQVTAALRAFEALGVEDQPLVGLAKREEELVIPGQRATLRLERRDPGLKLLQQIRDEAHRFAVSRHRRRRAKASLKSRFDDLQGIGEVRRKALVRRFGSYRGVAAAEIEALEEVLGAKLARRVHDQIHGGAAAAEGAETSGET